MNNLTIRPVQKGDAEFLTQLMNHPALLHRLHQLPSSQTDWEDAVHLWLQDDDEKAYIVTSETIPIGWFAFNGLLSPVPYLKIAVLLPTYQGKGIGNCVLSQLLPQLKAAGYSSVRLFTDCDNLPALSCYQKCGFQTIATVPETWPDGSATNQYEMEKHL